MGHPSRPLTAENALLVAVTRGVRDVPSSHQPAGDLDWTYIHRAADRQGVLPLLHEWLQHEPGVPLDAATRASLHEAYWRGHFRNRLLFEELHRIVASATARGVQVMPMKGAVLAPRYYDRLAQRPLSDLDLLVRPRDIEPLGAILQVLGYGEIEHAPSYVDERWLEIDSRDYCWFASRQGFDSLIEYRVAPLELAVGRLTDLDDAYTDALRAHAHHVWERARPSSEGTHLVQAPEDLLLHVATHLAAKHLDFRLIWLHDLARILIAVPGLDWDYVIDQSRALRVLAPMVAALEAARDYAGAPVEDVRIARMVAALGPETRMSLAHRDLTRLRRHVQGLASRDLTQEGPWGWPLEAALSRVHGWKARIRVLRWVMLPSREYLEHRGTGARGPLQGVVGSLKRVAVRVRRANNP